MSTPHVPIGDLRHPSLETRQRIAGALAEAKRVAVGTQAPPEVRVRMMHPGVVLSDDPMAPPVLYLASMRTDPKVREMTARPEVALLMHESPDGTEYSSWEIELTGRARLVETPEERQLACAATARTSAIVRAIESAGQLDVLAFLRIEPTFIKHRRFAEIVQGQAPDLWDLRETVAAPSDRTLWQTQWAVWKDSVRWPTLSASLASVAVGAAATVGTAPSATFGDGGLTAARVALAALGAVALQAALNVRNDLDDDTSGADAANATPMIGFTGGSRVLQRGLATRGQLVGLLGGLLALSAACGLLLMTLGRPLVLLWGLWGLLLGWTYTGRTVSTARWGLGELAVALAFGVGIVTGAAYAVAGTVPTMAWALALPISVSIGLVLYINSFQDAASDRRVGKMTLVARLGTATARHGYALFPLMAAAGLVLTVVEQILPPAALLGLLVLPLWGLAWRVVRTAWDAPQDLVAANAYTAVAHTALAALLGLGVLWPTLWGIAPLVALGLGGLTAGLTWHYGRTVWQLAAASRTAVAALQPR